MFGWFEYVQITSHTSFNVFENGNHIHFCLWHVLLVTVEIHAPTTFIYIYIYIILKCLKSHFSKGRLQYIVNNCYSLQDKFATPMCLTSRDSCAAHTGGTRETSDDVMVFIHVTNMHHTISYVTMYSYHTAHTWYDSRVVSSIIIQQRRAV